ncbi:putative membrane protein YgcG [Deinococcus metalli]|uniref:Putative membrane protein YgcG n=1 Tax=Deinococcus metalli TaxID=1141878 RepID=A0A7W8KJK0_9DEIO|nr:hypothetical protein [Deinococcus metalli]MBB5378136.1 putative membrane protein YgcG [Deinococcus metalli]GHF56290.1 hypothetical protein GCM10017781_35760 [Deinococcus metalli]
MTALLIVGIVVLGTVFVVRWVATAARRGGWSAGNSPETWTAGSGLDVWTSADDEDRSHTHSTGGHDSGGDGGGDSGGGDSGGSSGDS